MNEIDLKSINILAKKSFKLLDKDFSYFHSIQSNRKKFFNGTFYNLAKNFPLKNSTIPWRVFLCLFYHQFFSVHLSRRLVNGAKNEKTHKK